MAIKKFRPQSPDKDLGKSIGDNALAKLGHLNRLVNDINGLAINQEPNLPMGKVDLRSVGPRVYFEKKDGVNKVDVIIPGVLEITRGENGGIYNAALQSNWNGNGPENTIWNSYHTGNYRPESYGWHNLLNVYDRSTSSWINAAGNYAPRCLDLEMIMIETTTNRVWLVKFLKWSVGQFGGKGGFAYERYELFPKVVFERPAFSPEVVDKISEGLIIKRDNVRGIYNAAIEPAYNNGSYTSPAKTLWSSEVIEGRAGMQGWQNLTNIKNRSYDYWENAASGNPLTNVDREMIMQDLTTGCYYMVKFTYWGSGNQNGGGAFTYERTLIPMDLGIQFADGTYQDSVKSSPLYTLTAFSDHASAASEFVAGNGYLPGRIYFYLNLETNMVGFVEVAAP